MQGSLQVADGFRKLPHLIADLIQLAADFRSDGAAGAGEWRSETARCLDTTAGLSLRAAREIGALDTPALELALERRLRTFPALSLARRVRALRRCAPPVGTLASRLGSAKSLNSGLPRLLLRLAGAAFRRLSRFPRVVLGRLDVLARTMLGLLQRATQFLDLGIKPVDQLGLLASQTTLRNRSRIPARFRAFPRRTVSLAPDFALGRRPVAARIFALPVAGPITIARSIAFARAVTFTGTVTVAADVALLRHQSFGLFAIAAQAFDQCSGCLVR